MKSLRNFICEGSNKVSFSYDDNPNWKASKIHVGVDYANNPLIIFGEPCSEGMQKEWTEAWNLVKPYISGQSHYQVIGLDKDIKKAFGEYKDEFGDDFDWNETKIVLCLMFRDETPELVTYTYGDDGAEVIK